ncbi:GT4 family glycosyltransferase PelF [Streptomyces gobiensis]|uniref:GT4 family glycosyltransferase PelF n=1 Tax=Streptomyces gobiensis TaxID=2875706 RepID=UPI001E615D67|nr:GT4 family glycosyltransferase PelF [Streptomyces gobiensis]UGY92478.1 GT4 family glycosyltransferase PelF [Streptomyces gobiensis]
MSALLHSVTRDYARSRRGGRRVTLLTEGTYPHVHGGVSTWCDQLVRGMPEVEFQVISLTGNGREPVTWELPPNVSRHSAVPLWGTPPGGARRAPRGRHRRRFLESYERFLHALLDPEPSAEFTHGLYELAALARAGQLTAALRTEAALRALTRVWTWPYAPIAAARPTLHDALTATDLLEHTLRPLAIRVPSGGIAHAVSGGLATLPALAAQELDGTPFLLTEHGIYLRERYLSYRGTAPSSPSSPGSADSASSPSSPVKALMLGFYRQLAAEGYRAARLVTPCNQYNRRWEERGGTPAERIRTVYNGVDPNLFPHTGPEPETLTLTWAGRIDPIKDLETLIRAYALLRPEFPQLRLRLFGGVPSGGERYRNHCAKLAATLGVLDGVTFEGRISQVSRAYAAGSVVLLSSISEGFPFSLIEAMSCGRATVSTDVGGVREAVGDTGEVVPPRDPEAMADATAALLRDPERRAELGGRARQRVIDQFTLRASVDAFRRIYRELGADIPVAPFTPAAPDSWATWGTWAATRQDGSLALGGAR